ncbi:MAG: CRISPR-associated ring nuclease [Ktedonobacteraceae bacterium]
MTFEDTYDEKSCFAFLSQLSVILKNCQQQGDMVYLSLAGGRKNMSAIMALVAPFFHRSLKGLYHIIDKYEGSTSKTSFISIQTLEDWYTGGDTARCLAAMHPNLDNLSLVCIPFENAPSITEDFARDLLTMTAEQLHKRWEKNPIEAEKQQFFLNIVNPDIVEVPLKVLLTKRAKKEFEKLDGSRKKQFINCFEGMRLPPSHLVTKRHDILARRESYSPYIYKAGGTAERPMFHTEPGDIIKYPRSTVNEVVVECLAIHRDEKVYDPTVKILNQITYSKDENLHKLEDILPAKEVISSILIVPMGTVPMIATQLYALLTTCEKHQIQEVILLHTKNESVIQAAERAKEAFEYQNVLCTMKSIADLEDIASDNDCEIYQDTLEQTIIELQQTRIRQHPDWRIDLALSGGRKGMAALALFAAQRTQLSEVYHTLITDAALNRRIEAETSSKVLLGIPQKDINERLFLNAYKDHEASFQLFKVPMGPLHGK